MNAIAYDYDQQVHVIIGKRQELARQAAQARLAKGETETRGSLVTRVRGLAGGTLIALGERLHPAARPLPELDPATPA
ncbi:MAG TPA: hypothetical protein VM450_15230 [Thermomicrobiales bacterium]|nr:hypothetical protein [Thermomicrobiales bacterium]